MTAPVAPDPAEPLGRRAVAAPAVPLVTGAALGSLAGVFAFGFVAWFPLAHPVLLALALAPVAVVFEQAEFAEFGAFGAVLLWPKLDAAPNTIRLVVEPTSSHRA